MCVANLPKHALIRNLNVLNFTCINLIRLPSLTCNVAAVLQECPNYVYQCHFRGLIDQ